MVDGKPTICPRDVEESSGMSKRGDWRLRERDRSRDELTAVRESEARRNDGAKDHERNPQRDSNSTEKERDGNHGWNK